MPAINDNRATYTEARNAPAEPGAGHQPPALMLPGPRIWKPKQLANFFGVSLSWVYDRTKKAAEDPIPRIPGVGRLSFDTQSSSFQAWMGRHLGVDTGAAAEQS